MSVSLVSSAPLFLFLAYLLGFHAWITFHGFSTYEYILWRRMKLKLIAKLKVTTNRITSRQAKKITEKEYKNWLKVSSPKRLAEQKKKEIARHTMM
jgi:hypothetical protein